jgi:lambda family phage portal protein
MTLSFAPERIEMWPLARLQGDLWILGDHRLLCGDSTNHQDGQLDFYGLQTLICREMIEAGEVLVRRRLRRSSDGLPVPLQLQVLEADFLDATKSGALGAGRLVQGIEFDPVGKRRAYWLHAEHPGNAWGALNGGLGSRPVPATDIAHVYEKQRTQARGVPWGAPVIRALRDLDDYEVAEIVRKKTEACVTAIVFGDDEAQQGIAPAVVDADGNRVDERGVVILVGAGHLPLQRLRQLGFLASRQFQHVKRASSCLRRERVETRVPARALHHGFDLCTVLVVIAQG